MTIALWDESQMDCRQMPAETWRLLQLLARHRGQLHAIGMLDLYESWSGETLPRDARGHAVGDVPSLSRSMRKLIDDLRGIWNVPIMSSSHVGYWIVADEAELNDVVSEFRARGLKSLATAARLKRISLADELKQLEMELQKTEVTA